MTVLSDLGASNSVIPTRTLAEVTGAYYLTDYYQSGDGTISGHPDYLPAFLRIQALVTLDSGALIQVPAGDFWLSGTFNMWKKLHIRGTHAGFQPDTAATRLIWPKNMTGIRSWSGGAEVGYPGPANTSSTFACIEDVGIFCTDGSTTTGHGIHMGSALRLNRVNVQGWGEDGVSIRAANAAQGSMLGNNANQWYISDSVIRSNKGNGLYVADADANAGVAHMISGGNNTLWDFVDYSWLGNTYIGCQSDGGGLGSFKGFGACNVIGCYNENKTTAFDPGVFIQAGILGTDQNSPYLSVSGDGSGARAAVVLVNGSGSVTKILPIYEGTGYTTATVSVIKEGDGSGLVVTPNIVGGKITSYTIVNGGSGYIGSGGQPGQIRANGSRGGLQTQGAFVVQNYYQSGDRYLDANICYNGNQLFTVHSYNGTANDYEEFQALNWDESSRSWQSLHGARVGIRYVGEFTATETGGRSGVLPKGSAEFPSGLWIGGGSTGRQMTNGTAAPSSGEYARGDIIWNTAPSAGGSMGWMCTTGGTAGAGAVFKAMPNLAA